MLMNVMKGQSSRDEMLYVKRKGLENISGMLDKTGPLFLNKDPDASN